jgi:hypothetical protein
VSPVASRYRHDRATAKSRERTSAIDARDGADEGWQGAVQVCPKDCMEAFGPSPDVPHPALLWGSCFVGGVCTWDRRKLELPTSVTRDDTCEPLETTSAVEEYRKERSTAVDGLYNREIIVFCERGMRLNDLALVLSYQRQWVSQSYMQSSRQGSLGRLISDLPMATFDGRVRWVAVSASSWGLSLSGGES